MKTRHCDECKHFNDEDVPGARVCQNCNGSGYAYPWKCKPCNGTGLVLRHNVQIEGQPASGLSRSNAGLE